MPELIASLTTANPADIVIGTRLRPVKRSGVESIRASVAQTGVLKDAIGLRKKKDGKLHLIYGMHRLTFALEEDWDTIDVKVWTCTDDWARLMEIDDNLAGADLDALDNALFLAERKRVYERLHPETKHGAKGLATIGGVQTDTMSVWSFATTTAEKFGLSERHVRRMIAAGTALDADDIAMLRRAEKPVTLADIQTISKIEPQHRNRVCAALAGGTATSASKALSQITAQPSTTLSSSDAKLKSLSDAFARADMKAKRQFVSEYAGELHGLLEGHYGCEIEVDTDKGDVVPFATVRAAE